MPIWLIVIFEIIRVLPTLIKFLKDIYKELKDLNDDDKLNIKDEVNTALAHFKIDRKRNDLLARLLNAEQSLKKKLS